MTAAVMRDVPPRIAGSASGILNTMRNIGQVLGDRGARLVLQASGRRSMSTTTCSRCGRYSGTRTRRRAMPSKASSSDRRPGANRSVRRGVRRGPRWFHQQLHDTFTAGALICLVAAAVAFSSATRFGNNCPRQPSGKWPRRSPRIDLRTPIVLRLTRFCNTDHVIRYFRIASRVPCSHRCGGLLFLPGSASSEQPSCIFACVGADSGRHRDGPDAPKRRGRSRG